MVKTDSPTSKRHAEQPAAPPLIPPALRTQTIPVPVPVAHANNSTNAGSSNVNGNIAGNTIPERLRALRDPSKAPVPVQTPTDQAFTQLDQAGNIVVTLQDQRGGKNPFLGPAKKDIDTEPVRNAAGLSGIFQQRDDNDPNGYFSTPIQRKNGTQMRVHNFVFVVIPKNMNRNTPEIRHQLGK